MTSKYQYEFSNAVGAISITEDFTHIEDHVTGIVTVISKETGGRIQELDTPEEFQTWRDTLEMDFAWKPHKVFQPTSKVAEAVDPAHYKGYIKEMQWLEALGHMPSFKNLDDGRFYAALEMQARKYLDRLGQKDAGVQELLKSIFYLEYLAACMHKGAVVKVEARKRILEEV
jgi:hypothetical protein